MKKVITLLLSCCLISGCTVKEKENNSQTIDLKENAGVQEYFIMEKKHNYGGKGEYNPIDVQRISLAASDIDLIKQLDQISYPFYVMTNCHIKDNGSLVDLYKDDTKILDQSMLTNGMVINIFPYYNEQTMNVLYHYTGNQVESDRIPCFISKSMTKEIDNPINEDFSNSYLFDVEVECPKDYLESKKNVKDVEFETIELKLQIVGVISSNSGNGDLFIPYETMIDFVKKEDGSIIDPDCYVVVSDDSSIVTKLQANKFESDVDIVKRAW